MGYRRAGFEVIGVDIVPQPNYPFRFYRYDVRDLFTNWQRGEASAGDRYSAVHASPPCQPFTAYRRRGNGVGDGYSNLIAETRDALQATGLPYVIENVPHAPLRDPVRLCGSSFGLDVRRHRLFECNFPVMAPPCDHAWQTPRFPAATNRKPNSRKTVEVGVWRIPLDVQRRAMGIDWMTSLGELSEAIPPAYTEHIGGYLMAEVERTRG